MNNPTPAPGGYDGPEVQAILARVCAAAGLNGSNPQLLRGHTNAVILLENEGVVVKIARRGTPPGHVSRTVQAVRHLMRLGFPTVPLHPVEQPILVDQHAVTIWTYLPQPSRPISAEELARPLRGLHALDIPPLELPAHDNVRAIRKSLSGISALEGEETDFLADRVDELEAELRSVQFALPPALIQGDPQHRNALRTPGGVVLCDWDTLAIGQPEWDLITVEVHCRRFGYGLPHYEAFANTYGRDITLEPGYKTLAAIRELRMVTTNARKIHHAPETVTEVKRRVQGLRDNDTELRWHIL
ncbi:aminoglycoside phosphotransferase family protein [Streptomyces sp. OspMP-M43]|uniref:aminoglycoside phosphotransferase family protein n=1 Tax=Streptomyces sp. OspMP-M43 TaxID=1839781 RepID=UPI000B8A5CC8|nr:aminoglycoside phosphotransferase family protein [Streptomyces sp. OspMP-M43]